MRIRLKQSWKRNQPFSVQLNDAEIVITRQPAQDFFQKHYELTWTWLNNTKTTLFFPKGVGKKRVWNIVVSDQLICQGMMVFPSLKESLLRVAYPRIEWKIADDVVIDRIWCCGGELRLSNGRRLATWREGSYATIVCRKKVPQLILSAIVGMVVARIFDPDVSDG